MAITVRPVPSKQFSLTNDPLTIGKINQGFVPTFEVTGTIANGDISAGAVSAEKAQADSFFYAGTGGSSTAFTLDLGSGLRPDSLADGVIVRAKLHTSCGNAPTLNVTGSGGVALGAKAIRRPADLAVVANDYLINQIVDFVYNSSGNSSAGAWVAQSPPAIFSPAVVADSRTLVVKNNAATPDTKVDVTADAIVLTTTTNQPYLATSVNVTIDTGAANGANALDSGSLTASTWYYVYVIFNPTTNTVAGLMSTSSTNPTMPSGCTFKALVSCVRSSSLTAFIKFWQTQRRVHIAPQVFITSFLGPGIGTWTTASGASSPTNAIDTLIPPIAKTAIGVMGSSTSSANGPHIGVSGGASPDFYGLQMMAAAPSAAASQLLSFFGASPFEVPLVTTQDFYWSGTGAAAINRIMISGYTI